MAIFMALAGVLVVTVLALALRPLWHGSRVVAFAPPSRARSAQWPSVVGSSLTVAGTAAVLGQAPHRIPS